MSAEGTEHPVRVSVVPAVRPVQVTEMIAALVLSPIDTVTGLVALMADGAGRSWVDDADGVKAMDDENVADLLFVVMPAT